MMLGGVPDYTEAARLERWHGSLAVQFVKYMDVKGLGLEHQNMLVTHISDAGKVDWDQIVETDGHDEEFLESDDDLLISDNELE